MLSQQCLSGMFARVNISVFGAFSAKIVLGTSASKENTVITGCTDLTDISMRTLQVLLVDQFCTPPH